jgi:hypothetical protein
LLVGELPLMADSEIGFSDVARPDAGPRHSYQTSGRARGSRQSGDELPVKEPGGTARNGRGRDQSDRRCRGSVRSRRTGTSCVRANDADVELTCIIGCTSFPHLGGFTSAKPGARPGGSCLAQDRGPA